MSTSYPKGHIPQNVWKGMEQIRKAKPKKVYVKPKKVEPKIKPKIKVPTDEELYDMNTKEQFDLLKKLGFTYTEIRNMRFEMNRVKAIKENYKRG